MNGSHLLPVLYAPRALDELRVIGEWNEKTHGRNHAARYVAMLQRQIDALEKSHPRGIAIESRPDMQYMRLGRRKQGHGHIAVYRVYEGIVRVLHVFHTAQDWQTKLVAEEPGE